MSITSELMELATSVEKELAWQRIERPLPNVRRSVAVQQPRLHPDHTKAIKSTAAHVIKSYPGVFSGLTFELSHKGHRTRVHLPVRGKRFGRAQIEREPQKG